MIERMIIIKLNYDVFNQDLAAIPEMNAMVSLDDLMKVSSDL